YSFSTVEITPLTAEQVARAQQALHVEENASEAQVRRAYRRLAAEEQRNRKSGDRTASKESAGLKQASELLLHYLQARKDRRPGPADRDTRGAFLVSIKGPINDGVEPARFGGAAKV
ncbi:MAG: hypothetical protein HYX93_00605, partial [Chloroflexi bacterium]|nr:hypothetical protein [Chloroflexota bacterium]